MKPQEKFLLRKQEMVTQITHLITSEGYENLTVRGICKELDISTGSFYHYFPDKGDLIKVLFTNSDDYFEHTVSKEFTEDETHNLLIFCEHYGIYSTINGVETCQCISMAPLDFNDQNYLDENRAIFLILYQLLERGEKKGQFHLPLPLDETTRMILVLLRGYCSDWAKRYGEYNLTSTLHTFFSIFMRILY